jgi:cation diffusion facilitator CzcD-associated flavoprotein CzcO
MPSKLFAPKNIHFKEHFPVFPSKNQVADYLDAYAKLLGTENIRLNCKVKNAVFDESNKIWRVNAENLVTKEQINYTSRFLVIGSGENSVPKVPKFPGQENFLGRIMHSFE